jgi:hypothetical protein
MEGMREWRPQPTAFWGRYVIRAAFPFIRCRRSIRTTASIADRRAAPDISQMDEHFLPTRKTSAGQVAERAWNTIASCRE